MCYSTAVWHQTQLPYHGPLFSLRVEISTCEIKKKNRNKGKLQSAHTLLVNTYESAYYGSNSLN